MARRFGWVRKLPSGRHQASYMSPDGVRVNAPTTFVKEEHADKWLAAQRTDIGGRCVPMLTRTASTLP